MMLLGTYTGPTGGIRTVRSELGEPIHKVATRGVKLWKEFDDTVFKLLKEKRSAWLIERRNEVVGKLIKDFSMPWFGWKKDGSVAKELVDDIRRSGVKNGSTHVRVPREALGGQVFEKFDWGLIEGGGGLIAGVEGRNHRCCILTPCLMILCRSSSLSSLRTLWRRSELLASEDSALFLAISQRAGRKPGPSSLFLMPFSKFGSRRQVYYFTYFSYFG
jgi:fatty acid synthase subunit beta